MRTLLLAFVLQISLSAALHSQVYYTVKFPDDRTVYGCPAKADTIWPEITKLGNCSFNVGVSIKDEVFYTSGTNCGKVLRTWKLNWWCDYNPNWFPTIIPNPGNTDIGVTVQGNSTNHGFIQYTQIIKLLDPVPPVIFGCPAGPVTFCDLTNNDLTQYGALCEGPVKLEVRASDACSKSNLMMSYRLFLDLDANGSMETYLSSSSPTAWPIETTVQGDTLTGKIKFPAGHGFPYGKHKIEWIVNDNCGNETLCKYEFIVKDCKPPTVVCINGLSINIMQTGMITLWDTDFLKQTYDNCTPTNQLKIGIRKIGTGTGFPTDIHSVTFDCTELGLQEVEVWSQDAFGNAGYCVTYVIIQDNSGSCPPPTPPSGNIKTASSKPLVGAKLTLKSTNGPGQWTTLTDPNGAYAFAAGMPACKVLLSVALDTLAKQGVNTLDALLAAAHIAGFQPLASPYQIISADANHDGLLDGDDLLDIIQLVTAQTGKFPEHAAWMFIPQDFVFPDPQHPFSMVFPENMELKSPGCYQNAPEHFVAVKVGDVNESVVPGQFNSEGNEDRLGETAVFTAPKAKCLTGVELRVPIQTPALANIAGFQFTLDYDPAYLVLDHVEPGLVPTSWTGVFPNEHSITGSWYSPGVLNPNGIGKNERKTAFTLVFRVLQDASLSKVLKMTGAKTQNEAYTRKLSTVGAVLEFAKPQSSPSDMDSYAVYPNPVHDQQVVASFFLDEMDDVSFTLADPSGNVVRATNATFAPGFHEVKFELPAGTTAGMLFLQMQTTHGTAVKKVVVQR